MEKAKTDRTYCVSKECDKKCFRHESNYEFDEFLYDRDNGKGAAQRAIDEYIFAKGINL